MSTQTPSTTELTDFVDETTEGEDSQSTRDFDWSDLKPAVEPVSKPRVRLHDITSQNTQNECRGCGAAVTRHYARTMGDQHDEVHECPNCPTSTQSRRIDGAAAGLEVSERQDERVMRR